MDDVRNLGNDTNTLQDLVREMLSQITKVKELYIKDLENEPTPSDADLMNRNEMIKSTRDEIHIDFKLLISDKKWDDIKKTKWYTDKNELISRMNNNILGLNFTKSTVMRERHSGMKFFRK